ncbi:MAG: hypothetical protein LAO77_23215 [Acidobacteriia bacterium]|nr:hypothetical protein [Terriglobia bacterium]
MPKALEVISGHIANVNTLTNLTTNTGDSLNVRSFNDAKKAYLLNTWAFVTAAGITEIHSPRMHDNVHAIHARVVASQPLPLMPMQFPQRLYSTDVLTVQLAGDNTAGRIQPQSLLVYYEDVQGLDARLMAPADVYARLVNIYMVETAITLGTGGDYSATAAINATSDFFQANTDYALLGYVPDINCASIHWKGADVGNVRVGGPGTNLFPHRTARWFAELSDYYNLPLVPVFNSNNKGAFVVDALMSQAGGTLNVTSVLAQLAK